MIADRLIMCHSRKIAWSASSRRTISRPLHPSHQPPNPSDILLFGTSILPFFSFRVLRALRTIFKEHLRHDQNWRHRHAAVTIDRGLTDITPSECIG